MPGMDGFELAHEIRNAPDLTGAVVMMLTSNERAEDIQRCRTLGISAYLTKPVRRAELRSAVCAAGSGAARQVARRTEHRSCCARFGDP